MALGLGLVLGGRLGRRESVTEVPELPQPWGSVRSSVWLDELPEIKLTWEPCPVDFAFGGREPATESYPSMLLLLYKGKHVKGYMSHHPAFGFKFLFLMSDMPYAKAFLIVGEKLSNRRRKTLLDTFYMYPGMEDYINSLTKDSVKDDPFCILKKLDELLGSDKQ